MIIEWRNAFLRLALFGSLTILCTITLPAYAKTTSSCLTLTESLTIQNISQPIFSRIIENLPSQGSGLSLRPQSEGQVQDPFGPFRFVREVEHSNGRIGAIRIDFTQNIPGLIQGGPALAPESFDLNVYYMTQEKTAAWPVRLPYLRATRRTIDRFGVGHRANIYQTEIKTRDQQGVLTAKIFQTTLPYGPWKMKEARVTFAPVDP